MLQQPQDLHPLRKRMTRPHEHHRAEAEQNAITEEGDDEGEARSVIAEWKEGAQRRENESVEVVDSAPTVVRAHALGLDAAPYTNALGGVGQPWPRDCGPGMLGAGKARDLTSTPDGEVGPLPCCTPPSLYTFPNGPRHVGNVPVSQRG